MAPSQIPRRISRDANQFMFSTRKPELLNTCVAGAQRRANQFIAIEIDEPDLFVTQQLFEAALREYKLRVALMSGSLSHNDRLCAHAPK